MPTREGSGVPPGVSIAPTCATPPSLLDTAAVGHSPLSVRARGDNYKYSMITIALRG